MDKILDRIQRIAINEGITIGALERKIGASKGVLSRAISKGTDIQSKWIQILVENYPSYSSEWLLTGRGDMIKSNRTFPENNTSCPNPELGNTISKDSDNNPIPQANSNFSADTLIRLITDKDETIRSMAEEIGRLKERIALLECRLQKDASSADTHHTANVG